MRISGLNSNIAYRPMTFTSKLPQKYVIEQIENLSNLPSYYTFAAVSKETGRRAGYMICRCDEKDKVSHIIKGNKVVPSLYVSELYSFDRGSGAGSALLDYARRLSQANGGEGNIHLVASGCYAPNSAPHIFYRKYGMNTGDKRLDRKIDCFIKRGKDAKRIELDNVMMYYPPAEYPKNNIISKLIHFIGNFFNNHSKCIAR